MSKIFHRLSLIVTAAILAGTYQLAAAAPQPGHIPVDASRGVLSFADNLEPALPSIVRIGRLDRGADKNLRLAGIGSGAVIDAKNGYVITNAHVVDNGESYIINLPDGRVVPAKLIGIDVATDIAVLQADDMRVSALRLGDSDALRVGDIVFAVGYPLGLEQSLSLGVVSGLGRSSSAAALQDFIQTDAAINSGNSGGPLLDSQGRLVGINTAIVSRGGGNNGIGFSVPIALASQVTTQLIRYGEVRRGTIGVEMAPVSEDDSERVGIDHWDGGTITAIAPGSTTERAGLKRGDVVIAFDGKPVKTPHALRARVGVAETNTAHRLTFIRANGVPQQAVVTVTSARQAIIESFEELGASVRELKPEDGQAAHVSGVYVYKVKDGSSAARAGLQIGDVISSINNEPADTMESTNRLAKKSKGRARLTIYRYGVEIPLFIEQ